MKDAGCDPIGPNTDQEYTDFEIEAGMTAALFVARQHSSTAHNALQRSAMQHDAVQCIMATPHLLLSHIS